MPVPSITAVFPDIGVLYRELYFLLNDYNLAIQFAKKSRLLFEKDSPNDIRAQDIIYFSNEKLRILQEEE